MKKNNEKQLYLKITWDCDGSTEIFPMSKKTVALYKKDIYEWFDYLHPLFGNFDNHSTWSVSEKAIVKRYRTKI